MNRQDTSVDTSILLKFGATQFFYMLIMNTVTLQLNIYATDLLLLPVALVGTVTILGKIIESVTAPLLGIMIEKTRLPWGKYRSWLFIACVPFTIFHMLIFFVGNMNLEPLGTAIAFGTFLIVGSLAGNVVQSVQSSLIQGITYKDNDRKRLVRVNMGGNYLAKAATGFGALALINYFAEKTGSASTGYTIVLSAVSVLGIIAHFILGTSVKKYNMEDVEDVDYSVREILKLTFSNKPLLLAFGAFFMKSGAYFTVIGLSSYYFKYVAENTAQLATFTTIINFVALAAILLQRVLFKYVRNKKAYFISLVVMGVSILVARFAGANYWLYIAAICFFSFGDSIVGVYSQLLFAEAVDYCEYKNGASFRGLSMCLHTLSLDGSRILQQIVITVGFTIMSYSASVGITPEQVPVLMNMLCIVPFCFIAMSVFFLSRYKLDEKTMEDIRVKLSESRAKVSS